MKTLQKYYKAQTHILYAHYYTKMQLYIIIVTYTFPIHEHICIYLNLINDFNFYFLHLLYVYVTLITAYSEPSFAFEFGPGGANDVLSHVSGYHFRS